MHSINPELGYLGEASQCPQSAQHTLCSGSDQRGSQQPADGTVAPCSLDSERGSWRAVLGVKLS